MRVDDGYSGTEERTDALRARVLQVTIVAAALAFSFRFTSFLDPKVAVLAVGLCLAAVCIILRQRFFWGGIAAFWPLWAVWGVQAILYVGLGRSAVPAATATALGRMALGLLVAAFAWDLLHRERWRRGLFEAVAVSTVLVALLALLQYAGLLTSLFPIFPAYDQPMYSVFGNQDLLGGYLALGLTLMLVRAGRGGRAAMAAYAGLAVLIPALLLSGSRSAWLAAACGAAVALAPMLKGRRSQAAALIGVMLLVTVLVVVSAPTQTLRRALGTFAEDDVGGRVRLWIWDGGLRMAADAPFLGRGVGSFGYWSPIYMADALHEAPHIHYYNERHAVHAHSDPLEWLTTTGLFGMLLLGWLGTRLFRCRGEEWAGLTALLVFACLNATFSSPPHATAAILLASALLAGQRPAVSLKPSRTAVLITAVAIGAVSAFLVGTDLVPSALLRSAEAAHLQGASSTLAAYQRAVAYPWPNADAQKSYGLALAERGHDAEAYHHLQEARKGVRTGDLYLALAIVAQRLGRADEAARWAEQCAYIWPKNATGWDILVKTAPTVEACQQIRVEAGRWLSPERLAALPACTEGSS
jgi:O-antigen ligase